MSSRERATSAERGAVAIMVAILAAALLTMAALAVDLGNAWSRKRIVQTQVDVSALSAGHLLPAVTATEQLAAAGEVAAYLNRANNQALGQPDVTAAQLIDPDPSNGNITFSADGLTMEVLAPEAWVDFGFAGTSARGAGVQASATIRLESPLPPHGKVLPFAVPDSCPFGALKADTGPPKEKKKADTTGTFTPSNPQKSYVDEVTPSPSPVTGGSDVPTTLTVKLSDLPGGVTSAAVVFQLDGAVYQVTAPSFDATSTAKNPKDTSRTISVNVPDDVLNTTGTWNVWGLVDGNHTKTSKPLVVSAPTAPVPTTATIACADPAHGQFGQMYSPRGTSNPGQRDLALNIAEGLDHDLLPWPSASSPDCGKKNAAPPTGGVQDKPSPVDTPNCVLPQTGNDGAWMLRGMITGKLIEPSYGRLDVRREHGHTRPGCGPGDVTRADTLINNDRLSCFLTTEGTLGALTAATGDFDGLLDPAVVDSPRFVWIPVIHASTRYDIDNNTYAAIARFVPGFITDESAAATKAHSDATSDNGITMSGQIDSIQLFTFNPLALPVDERAPSTTFDPLMGRIVRLVG